MERFGIGGRFRGADFDSDTEVWVAKWLTCLGIRWTRKGRLRCQVPHPYGNRWFDPDLQLLGYRHVYVEVKPERHLEEIKEEVIEHFNYHYAVIGDRVGRRRDVPQVLRLFYRHRWYKPHTEEPDLYPRFRHMLRTARKKPF